jgi:hypothetical protein
MATQPGDEPGNTPPETPIPPMEPGAPNLPGDPGGPDLPEELPPEGPDFDEPDTGPLEIPPAD